MSSKEEADKIVQQLAVAVQNVVKEERKRILEGILAIDRDANSHFDFSMAMKSWICQEFKEEMRELKK